MISAVTEFDRCVAARIRAFRHQKGLTRSALASRASISGAAVSMTETLGSRPSAAILHRMATAMGVTLDSLAGVPGSPGIPPLQRRADQVAQSDGETGYVRRILSPPGFASLVELAEMVLPPGARVVQDSAVGTSAIDQHVWLLEGAVDIAIGDTTHHLADGDCLAMRLDRPVGFVNHGPVPARCVVARATTGRSPLLHRRRRAAD